VGVDFKTVAAAALEMAPQLLSQWLGGARHGREWRGARKANGGPGDSWSVNLHTGVWANFSGEARGPDLIALYAELNHLEQVAALHQVAALVGVTERSVPVLPRSAPAPRELPAESIPDHAPALLPHIKYGPPSAVYRYGDAFLIARWDLADGSKTFAPFTWRGGTWHKRGYPAPRPLYGAEYLRKHPTVPILIVEGEKCADAAARVMKYHLVMTWAGGAQSVEGSQWTALAGRDVLIWPDADAPGYAAGAKIAELLANVAKRVRIVNPEGQPAGWDIADAIGGGWDLKRLTAWASEHLRREPALATLPPERSAATLVNPDPPPTDAPVIPSAATASPPVDQDFLPAADHDEDYEFGAPPRSSVVMWKEIGLAVDSKEKPYATLANASLIMRFHPAFKGKIWWDSFCERIYHTLYDPVAREWNDVDSARITAFIQRQMDLPKITLKLVQEALVHAAHAAPRNSVLDWLNSLRWNGVERLDTWVGDCLGVELTPYTQAVGRNWLLSMVARAYKPGCQVDTMPVLEGLQGEGKSSALEILGDRWYAAVGTAFGSYDFIQTIQGKWLIEIPDMAGFSRREHSHVIATITTRTDRYRMKYGRFDQDHPRQCIFAATSETDDYLPEMRGYRRYWPLRCTEINLEALRTQREQLFAEAVHAWRAGASFHRMPNEATATEQRARSTEDLWTEDVLTYCEPRALAGHPVHPAKILTDSPIQMERKHLDLSVKLRVINILKAHGWVSKTIDNQRQYVKPRRNSKEEGDL
jgi:predicted P-loop ATPase